MSSLIGQSLGRYQILEQLGEGGMATVYKARDTRLERFVAIKVIRPDQFAPAMLGDVMKRFEREAKALARLSHPNIVHVHDYGEYEGAPYLVMEYLPSGSLKDQSDSPMPWQQAVRLLLPIAQALAYAHEYNVIHRDIKPANILLREKGLPMLSDFGIAKILEGNEGGTLTGTGMSIGTPGYMAPEQWNGESGPQSDIYALGVVLYELVTGRKPYIADTPMSLIIKQVNDPLPRPRQFVQNLPEELENMLLKALEKRPEDRYPSMSEFAAALETLAVRQALSAGTKKEGIQAAEAMLATGGAGQEAEQTPALDGGGSRPSTGPTPDHPASPKIHRQPAFINRRRWVPVGGLVMLMGIGVVIVASILLKGNGPLAAQAKGTPTPTLLTSSHAEFKVLWDISHGPRTSEEGSLYTPKGMYQSLTQLLANDKFVISSGDLSNLNSYDILVLSELSGRKPYTDGEVGAIVQFVRVSGHGLLILSDTPTFENLADVVGRRFSIGLGELTSGGPVTFSAEPFFSGVSSIHFLSGVGILRVSRPAQTAAVDQGGNTVVAYCDCDAGRVMAISDANLWDNHGLSQADNQRFALNVFHWLAKLSP